MPREEQLIRAQVLCRRGLCDYLHPHDIAPKALWEKLLNLLENGSSYSEKMASFPFSALRIIRGRVFDDCTRN